MNRFRNYVLMAAGFAVLAMVVGVFSAGPAIAQAVRAALVSNVDDPGRIPYRLEIAISDICGICFSSIDGIPRVPSGKRLVITNVTGRVDSPAPAGHEITLNVNDFNLSPLPPFPNYIPMTFSGQSDNKNVFEFNQQVFLVYDAGDVPTVTLKIDGTDQRSFAAAFLRGYMLDCTAAPCAAVAH